MTTLKQVGKPDRVLFIKMGYDYIRTHWLSNHWCLIWQKTRQPKMGFFFFFGWRMENYPNIVRNVLHSLTVFCTFLECYIFLLLDIFRMLHIRQITTNKPYTTKDFPYDNFSISTYQKKKLLYLHKSIVDQLLLFPYNLLLSNAPILYLIYLVNSGFGVCFPI